jgi:hypothetical protein
MNGVSPLPRRWTSPTRQTNTNGSEHAELLLGHVRLVRFHDERVVGPPRPSSVIYDGARARSVPPSASSASSTSCDWRVAAKPFPPPTVTRSLVLFSFRP